MGAQFVNLALVRQKRRQEAYSWANEVLKGLNQPKESVRILLDDDAAYAEHGCIPSLFCNREDGRTLFRRDWLNSAAFSCYSINNLGELCARYGADRINQLLENGVSMYRYFTVPGAPRPSI